MIVLIAAFLSLTIGWLFYWALIRPMIIESVAAEFDTLRATVDWAIIDDLPHAQTKAARVLVRDLAHSESVQWISLGTVVWHLVRRRSQLKLLAAEDFVLFEEAPRWMQDARRRDVLLTTKAALVNSPAWWIPIAILLLGTVFSMKIAQFWQDAQLVASRLRSDNVPLPN